MAKEKPTIIISGAGGIAEALALILCEWSPRPLQIWVGNRTFSKAEKLVNWVKEGCTRKVAIEAFHLPEKEPYGEEVIKILQEGEVLLDCLPGSQAPRMAELALSYHMHYANLTEYIKETEQIKMMARNAEKGFVLQTGLAPGFINVLAHGLFLDFTRRYLVEKVAELHFRVGALTEHAHPPAYYGFTWSPVGVATEYVRPAVVVRNHKKTTLPSLSERQLIRIKGLTYEEDLTSGGAADLPDALADKVESLDYKTLRHPGHYSWIEEKLADIREEKEQIALLQAKMEATIPHIENDMVVVYAAVQGVDHKGILRRMEKAYFIRPQIVGRHRLRAIQTTTAGPMAEVALMLTGEHHYQGIVLQSMIPPADFLEGAIIKRIY